MIFQMVMRRSVDSSGMRFLMDDIADFFWELRSGRMVEMAWRACRQMPGIWTPSSSYRFQILVMTVTRFAIWSNLKSSQS
jgi:hypothetical protein